MQWCGHLVGRTLTDLVIYIRREVIAVALGLTELDSVSLSGTHASHRSAPLASYRQLPRSLLAAIYKSVACAHK
jgi:hypothetical protein